MARPAERDSRAVRGPLEPLEPGERGRPALPGPDEDDYHMAHRERGKALIFNQWRFDPSLPHLSPRKGTEADAEALQQQLSRLRFKVEVHTDLARAEVLAALERERTNRAHYVSDCLVVAVLTHGEGGDQLYARDAPYETRELWERFTADRCQYLASKPKIFIIQACRGELASAAVSVRLPPPGLATDSTPDPGPQPQAQPQPTVLRVPAEADILLAFSTFEGRLAHRDTEEGTWFIGELCRELGSSALTDDLLTLLTRVNRRVALQMQHGRSKQMPTLQSTLTRRIFFGPRPAAAAPPAALPERLERLERLLERLLEAGAGAGEAPRPPGSDWEALRAGLAPPPAAPLQALAEAEVLRLAKALQLFLEDEQEQGSDGDALEEGRALLCALSAWPGLEPAARGWACSRLVAFLRERAARWRMLPLLPLPAEPAPDCRGRRHSRASSTGSGSGLPAGRPRPPFK